MEGDGRNDRMSSFSNPMTVHATKVSEPRSNVASKSAALDSDPDMAKLQQMGFSDLSANRAALIAADNNVEAAIGILLGGGLPSDNPFGVSSSSGAFSQGSSTRKACDIPPHRVEDQTVKECCACGKVFGGMRAIFSAKRHHCRNCGNIFCDACSTKRAVVHLTESDKPERVCERCNSLIAANDRDSYARYILLLANDAPVSPTQVSEFQQSCLEGMAAALEKQAKRGKPPVIAQDNASSSRFRTRLSTLPADIAEFEYVTQGGGMRIIKEFLTGAYAASPRVQGAACNALRGAMALYEARGQQAEFFSELAEIDGKSESVVRSLSNLCGRKDEQLQGDAVKLLLEIVQKDAAARLLVCDAGSIGRLCQLLISSRDQTQEDAASTLGHLLSDGDMQAKKAVRDANGMQYLCMLLSARSSSVQMAALDTTAHLLGGSGRGGAGTIDELSILESAKKELADSGGVAPLCEMLQRRDLSQSARVKALQILTAVSSAGGAVGRSIVQSGGARGAVGMLRDGSLGRDDQAGALQLMVNVASQSSANGRAVHNAGGLGIATSLLHSGDDDLVDKATELVNTLSALPEASKVVREYGGVEVLVQQLDDDDLSTRIHAMDSLKNMVASDAQNCVAAATAGLVDSCLRFLRSRDGRDASLRPRAAECLCRLMQHPIVRERELKRGSVGAITSELLMLLKSSDSGRAAAAALAGLCGADQGRTIAAALSASELAEAAPKLLLAADDPDPAAASNAAVVVAQLLHRGGAQASATAARSGGLNRAVALLNRRLTVGAHIAAIDMIVMMCTSLGDQSPIGAEEHAAIRAVVQYGLRRSWEQGDVARTVFARAVAACAVLSNDIRRAQLVVEGIPVLFAVLKHPQIVSAKPARSAAATGWKPQKVMHDTLQCLGRLCRFDEGALAAITNGVLPLLFGLLEHQDQTCVANALYALLALSTPGRRARGALIATGVDGVLRLTRLLQSPIVPPQSVSCILEVLKNVGGVSGQVGSNDSGVGALAGARALTDTLCTIIVGSRAGDGSPVSPRNRPQKLSPPSRSYSPQQVVAATQILSRMCAADGSVWAYIRTQNYIEAAAALLKEKSTQLQACAALVGMCSDDEALLERLVRSESWNIVLRLLAPSAGVQAQHTALQLVLVASTRPKLRPAILVSIDIGTLLALLTCNEDVARVAALSTFCNLCDSSGGGGGVWRRVVSTGQQQLALRQLYTVLEVEVGNANERAVGFVSKSIGLLPEDVGATMGPQELEKCRSFVQLLVPVVRAGDQVDIDCRAAALGALSRLARLPKITPALVDAGVMSMAMTVIADSGALSENLNFLKCSLALLRSVLSSDSKDVARTRASFLKGNGGAALIALLEIPRDDGDSSGFDWSIASDALAILGSVCSSSSDAVASLAKSEQLLDTLAELLPAAAAAASSDKRAKTALEAAIDFLAITAVEPTLQVALLRSPELLKSILAIGGDGEDEALKSTRDIQKNMLPRVVRVLRSVALAAIAVDRSPGPPSDGRGDAEIEAVDIAAALIRAVLRSKQKSSQTFTSFSDKRTSEAVSEALDILSLLCTSADVATRAVEMGLVQMALSLGKESGVGGVSFGVSTTGRKSSDKLATAAVHVVASVLGAVPVDCATAILQSGGISTLAAVLDSAFASGDDVRSQMSLGLVKGLALRSQRAKSAAAKNSRIVQAATSMHRSRNICVKVAAASCLAVLGVAVPKVAAISPPPPIAAVKPGAKPGATSAMSKPPPSFNSMTTAPRGAGMLPSFQTATMPRGAFGARPRPAAVNMRSFVPPPPNGVPPRGGSIAYSHVPAPRPMASQPIRNARTPPRPPPQLRVDPSLRFLVESGFSESKAKLALQRANGDKQKAMNMLLDNAV